MARKKTEPADEVKFTKAQIYSADKYKDSKDIIKVVLEEEQGYSFKEVDALIEKFLKGKVK